MSLLREVSLHMEGGESVGQYWILLTDKTYVWSLLHVSILIVVILDIHTLCLVSNESWKCVQCIFNPEINIQIDFEKLLFWLARVGPVPIKQSTTQGAHRAPTSLSINGGLVKTVRDSRHPALQSDPWRAKAGHIFVGRGMCYVVVQWAYKEKTCHSSLNTCNNKSNTDCNGPEASLLYNITWWGSTKTPSTSLVCRWNLPLLCRNAANNNSLTTLEASTHPKGHPSECS